MNNLFDDNILNSDEISITSELQNTRFIDYFNNIKQIKNIGGYIHTVDKYELISNSVILYFKPIVNNSKNLLICPDIFITESPSPISNINYSNYINNTLNEKLYKNCSFLLYSPYIYDKTSKTYKLSCLNKNDINLLSMLEFESNITDIIIICNFDSIDTYLKFIEFTNSISDNIHISLHYNTSININNKFAYIVNIIANIEKYNLPYYLKEQLMGNFDIIFTQYNIQKYINK